MNDLALIIVLCVVRFTLNLVGFYTMAISLEGMIGSGVTFLDTAIFTTGFSFLVLTISATGSK